MLCIRSQTFLFVLTLVFVSSTFLSLSHGTSKFLRRPQTIHIQGIVGEYPVVSWGLRRSLLEGSNAKSVQNSSLILAAERTHRRDPLDDFKHYKGGWNISEKHYFSSVGFTAAPLFAIAAIWFPGFGFCLLVICLCYCCCQRRCGYSKIAYSLSLILLMIFTIAAIIGCVVLFIGQKKFHSSATSALNFVLRQENITVEILRNILDDLDTAKQIEVDHIVIPPNIQNHIYKVEIMINASANTLENRTEENLDHIQRILDSVRLALVIIAAVMLLLALLGFIFSFFGMQFLVYILAVVGWILVAVTLILCGVFLILHNVVADTCVAMDQWVQHPTAQTSLDDILACVDNATAQETVYESKEVTFQLIDIVNFFITNVANKNFPPSAGLYYNQSGPSVPVLCNPFYSDKTDRKCNAGEVDFNNAVQEWRKYVCKDSAAGICTNVGRITPPFYSQMTTAVNVSYSLHHHGPFLVELADCTFVRETFIDINKDHCPSLRRYSKWINVGLIMVSAAIMLSLIFWIIYARERRQRLYTNHLTGTSSQDLLVEKG